MTTVTYPAEKTLVPTGVRSRVSDSQRTIRFLSSHTSAMLAAMPADSLFPHGADPIDFGPESERLPLSGDPVVFAHPFGHSVTHEFPLEQYLAEKLGTGFFQGLENAGSHTLFANPRQRSVPGSMTVSWPWKETRQTDQALTNTLEMEQAEISFEPIAASLLGAIYDLGHISCEELAARIETPDEWIWFSRLQRARLVYDLGEAFTLSREGLAVVERLLSEEPAS